MEEPLQKDLGFNITATLARDGSLTLTEIVYPPKQEADGSLLLDEPSVTELRLPAQATRSLHNFLRTETARTYTGYHKQKEGKRHGAHQTRRQGYLRRLFRRWLRQGREAR